MSVHVIKVGGSLFDLPALRPGLRHWLAQQSNCRVLLVPGGGPLADAIRNYHHVHHLQEEQSHWLAVRTMQINAELLCALLGGMQIIDHPDQMLDNRIAILDAYSFCQADEDSGESLPHHWQITSDSIAARVAVVAKASALVMLKSIDLQTPADWQQVAAQGGIDDAFASVVSKGAFEVSWINFREWLAKFGAPEIKRL